MATAEPRTVEESAAETLRLAVAGELYAACREARSAVIWHGPLAGSLVALYVVDTALQIHALKCQHADTWECAWTGIDDSSARARWAVRLVEARQARDMSQVRRLMRKGHLADVLDWAATVICNAHSGPQAGLLRELTAELTEWTRQRYVAPPVPVHRDRITRVPQPSTKIRPSVEIKPPDGYLGLGLWRESA